MFFIGIVIMYSVYVMVKILLVKYGVMYMEKEIIRLLVNYVQILYKIIVYLVIDLLLVIDVFCFLVMMELDRIGLIRWYRVC